MGSEKKKYDYSKTERGKKEKRRQKTERKRKDVCWFLCHTHKSKQKNTHTQNGIFLSFFFYFGNVKIGREWQWCQCQ